MPSPDPDLEGPPLPRGFEASRFDEEDLEYLAEFFCDYRRHLLDELMTHAWAMPEGVPLNAVRLGLNTALLARLAHWSDELTAMPLQDMARLLHTRKETLLEQRTALLASIRRYNPRVQDSTPPQVNHRYRNPPRP